MPPEDTLLAAIVADPADSSAWLALADCLEEQSRDDEAELLRVREKLRALPGRDAQLKQQKRLQRLLAADVKPLGPTVELSLGKKTTMPFVFVPPGSFVMGSPASESGRYMDEGPQHKVTLTRGFWFARTPVSQQQWQAITGRNPSRFVAPNQPVESITWYDARAFCRLLSERLRVACRLPTEAEWEYACRGCTTTRFHGGSDEADLARVGWYHNNTDYGTRPLLQKLPNAWGLHDLHGNVREWCLDGVYDYPHHEETDPLHDESDGERMLRGGSWYNSLEMCRSAFRFTVDPHSVGYGYGMRVLMELGSEPR